MKKIIKSHCNVFPKGFTSITKSGESSCDTGMDFGILKLSKGETFYEKSLKETAYLQMEGSLKAVINDSSYYNVRHSLFNDQPFCIHLPSQVEVELHAEEDVEIAICRTNNLETFPYVVYFPGDIDNEYRGKDQVEDTCLRWVRTIFDGKNSHPNAKLVLGEVVNMPGKWSSYPPHHHPQPEIYHYRFTDKRGYGHAELGEEVLKVRSNDTVKILDGVDHAQCAAPGYGMYYIWLIRHLPEIRYTVPEFTEDHIWIMEENANYWKPRESVLL